MMKKEEKEEDIEILKKLSNKHEEKYHRPVSSSINKTKEQRKEKEKSMNYAQYKSKHRPNSGIFK